ncbi:MAG: SGNH/GDSL hydrolase family protein [Calothrix sp. MO_192.B10]|nr:SGNH/GDSL hydrolase family protein [Calothrix sp. MO_192.B10]
MSTSAKTFPIWAMISLLTNGLLVLAVILLLWRQQLWTAFLGINSSNQTEAITPQLGPRRQLNYQQWLGILDREARVVAQKRPKNLTILAGDSLTLWFPAELLPTNKHWLNQGISGESSAGLLKRLKLLDKTQPKTIFVMIGINDLIRGVKGKIVLENQRQIVRYLRKTHPQADIVIQSILPHGGKDATWEGKEKLLAIPSSRIRKLNQQLQAIANQEGVRYLDLYSLFTNEQGNMRLELTTDGLHLSSQGYLVWSSALQLYSQMKL